MKTMGAVLFVFLLILFPAMGFAQTVVSSCDKVTWDANTEPDLAGYNLYVEKDGTPMPAVPIPPSVVEYDCALLTDVVEGGNYKFEITAFDESGNEGMRSVPFLMNWPDATPPATVKNTCWEVVEKVIDPVTGQVLSSQPATICQTIGP